MDSPYTLFIGVFFQHVHLYHIHPPSSSFGTKVDGNGVLHIGVFVHGESHGKKITNMDYTGHYKADKKSGYGLFTSPRSTGARKLEFYGPDGKVEWAWNEAAPDGSEDVAHTLQRWSVVISEAFFPKESLPDLPRLDTGGTKTRTQVFTLAGLYEGLWKNNAPQQWGKLILDHGGVYEGEWDKVRIRESGFFFGAAPRQGRAVHADGSERAVLHGGAVLVVRTRTGRPCSTGRSCPMHT